MTSVTENGIEVQGRYEEELAADSAELYVRVSGTALFTGRAALTQAKEVAAIVQALKGVGLDDSAIELLSVSAEVRSGLLGKSSAAAYDLKVRCADLECLPSALGAVTGAKNATLDRLVWSYPSGAELEGRLLAAAASLAKSKARAIATAVGVSLGELQEAREVIQQDALPPQTRFSAPSADVLRARMSEPVDVGVQLQHRKKVTREVHLRYAVVNHAE